MIAVSIFRSHMNLQYDSIVSYKMPTGQKLWMERKAHYLESLGYFPEDPRCKLVLIELASL